MQNDNAAEEAFHLGLTASPEHLSPQQHQRKSVRTLTSWFPPRHLNNTSVHQRKLRASGVAAG